MTFLFPAGTPAGGGANCKRLLQLLMVSTVLSASAGAFAQDNILSQKSVRDWSGFYGGVHTGVMVGRTTTLEYSDPFDLGEYTMADWAALGGFQLGVNNQVGNFVYGAEADFAFTSFDENQLFYDDEAFHHGEWKWMATVRARAGLAVGDGLFFATAGLAFVNADYLFSYSGDSVSYSGTVTGLALGAGYEHSIDENWSWRADYLYVGLPNERFEVLSGDFGVFTSSAHMARIALNYAPGQNTMTADTATATTGDWSGAYVGGNFGGLIGRSTSLEYGGPWDFSEYTIEDWAAAGGVQAGFNIQNGHSVLGLEADFNWSSFDGQHLFRSGAAQNSVSWDWFSTVRARAGLAVGNTLAYVTGGIAIVQPDYNFGFPASTFVSSNPTQVGIAAGAGVEVAWTNRLSTRLEYLHIALPEEFIPDFGGDAGSFSSSAHLGRVAINYALGDGINPGSGTALPDTIDWTGVYLGPIGGAMMVSSTTVEYAGPLDYGSYSLTDWAGSIGGLVGANFQMGNFVYGAEADLSWTSWDQQHVFSIDGLNRAHMPWLATVRGRAGIAAGNSLIYATGGIAIANLHHEFGDDLPIDVVVDTTEVGLAVGAGFEHDFGNGWAARLEAMHIAFPAIIDYSYTDESPMNFTNSTTTARIAFTRRFGM